VTGCDAGAVCAATAETAEASAASEALESDVLLQAVNIITAALMQTS
jgi:hypothetical protein